MAKFLILCGSGQIIVQLTVLDSLMTLSDSSIKNTDKMIVTSYYKYNKINIMLKCLYIFWHDVNAA